MVQYHETTRLPVCLMAMVRSLCDAVYEVCEAFRNGSFGAGTAAGKGAASHAIAELSKKQPGFSDAEYEAAFAAGLLWIAF